MDSRGGAGAAPRVFRRRLGEALGWSGYAIDPRQARWGVLRAGVLLGSVSTVWHFVSLAQVHRSPGWIAWWSLGTVAQRVLMTWLYNNTGRSVFTVAVFHATDDLSTVGPLPDFGPGGFPYDAQRIASLLLAAAVVTAVWGPRTLARRRHA